MAGEINQGIDELVEDAKEPRINSRIGVWWLKCFISSLKSITLTGYNVRFSPGFKVFHFTTPLIKKSLEFL